MSTGENSSTGENPVPQSDRASDQASGPPATDRPDKPTAAGRGSGPLAARGLGTAKPASPSVSTEQIDKSGTGSKPIGGKPGPGKKKKKAPRPKLAGEKRDTPTETSGETEPAAKPAASKDRPGRVAVPNRRRGLDDDLQAELDAELAAADFESMLGESAGMADRKEQLAEGTRVAGVVLKLNPDSVFIALGGPDEGVAPFEQFETEPAIGSQVEVVVRGFNPEDGLYAVSLPGGKVEVSDWEDIEEGSVVEATITGNNSGGLECKVGGVRGFIPISQISEYRVEDTSEFVDKKLLCVVTESNQRRGNLVLSHRAILEREREEKRKEQLEKIQPGDLIDGMVRSVKDFGAFVDLGGLDGLIHISKLSWDRVKHPSEVVSEGDSVKVKVDSIDKESGKISLSYRDLLENPWDTAEGQFGAGSVHRGTVTRTADFGAFVRLTAGVEGLVHISELANHRVSRVDTVVTEGEEVEVKVLSFDRDSQKISLSIKQAQAGSAPATTTVEDETPPPEVAVKPQHAGPLRGGNDRGAGGERFGLKW